MRKYQPPKDHFFGLPNSVFALPLDAAQFKLYAYLVCRSGSKGYCRPTLRTIIWDTGIKKTSLQKAFKVLKNRKIIAVQKHRNPYGYANNEYHLLSLENPEIYRQPEALPLMAEERPAERLLKRKMSTEHQALLHSGQGVQYSSAGYCNLLKEYNVIQSMSRTGNPRDNAVMESYWGRFKDTLRKHFRYLESDDLRSVVEQAIRYFNYERPLRKLNGKPPVLFRTQLVA